MEKERQRQKQRHNLNSTRREKNAKDDAEMEQSNFATDPEIPPAEQYQPRRKANGRSDNDIEESEWLDYESRRDYEEKSRQTQTGSDKTNRRTRPH